MSKYLIGNSRNAWNFGDAYSVAQNGDIFDFEPNINLNAGNFIIKKDITLRGQITQQNGNTTFLNTIFGGIIVDQATVRFENLWFAVPDNSFSLAITNQANVVMERCYFASQAALNQNAFVSVNNGASLIWNNVGTQMGDNTSQYMYACTGNIQIHDSIISNRILAEGLSTLNIIGSKITNYSNNNIIHLDNVSAAMERTTIEGGIMGSNLPIILLIHSRFEAANSSIMSHNYANQENMLPVALSGNIDSHIKLNNCYCHSVHLHGSIGQLCNVEIEEFLFLYAESYCYARGYLSYTGSLRNNIPLKGDSRSTIVIESLELPLEEPIGLELAKFSTLLIRRFISTGSGDKQLLSIHADESSYYDIWNRYNYGESIEAQVVEDGHILIEKTQETSSIQGKQVVITHSDWKDSYNQLERLIGLESVKKEIETMLSTVDFDRRRIEQGLPPVGQSLHSLFLGNPGTGKTTVARLIGKILYGKGALKGNEFKFVEVDASDLLSKYINQSAEQTKEKLEEALGGVLFIDEAYALYKKGNNSSGEEAVTTILKFMEDYRDEIMIIFAGYTKEMEQFLTMNPGLKSRVPNVLMFEDYTPEQIISMGVKKLLDEHYEIEDEEYYSRCVKKEYQSSLDKSNARWIRNFNEKLKKSLALRVGNDTTASLTKIMNEDITAVLSKGKYEQREDKKDALVELQSLIGLQKVKEQVEEFIAQAELNRKREEAGHKASQTTLHSVFLGNPGTGKTTVARIIGELLYQKGIIATNKFYEVSRGDLIGGYQGQTAEKTREQLNAALGGVLFIDEAYSLKHGPGDTFGQEAIDEILKFMEDHRSEIVVIFAGYYKEMQEFLQTNSGLMSRVPNTFDFEDYSSDEIVQIGMFGLNGQGYEFDETLYSDTVKKAYLMSNDHSNGRWIRNFNQKLIGQLSRRVSRDPLANVNQLIEEDFIQLLPQ